jgi:hypothetical protein
MIEALVKDEDPMVRAQLAKNPHMSLEILDRLALDPIATVRYSLVENVQTPTRILDELVNCPEARIRFKVLEHPNLSLNIAIKLSNDIDFMVRKTASRYWRNLFYLSKNSMSDFAEQTFARIYAKIRNNSDLQSEYAVLEWLVQQPQTPDWFFELLASNEPSELYEIV